NRRRDSALVRGLGRLELMPFGNSGMDAPEGQMKIAQRFNAGRKSRPEQVPKGRLTGGANRYSFSRPFGTQVLRLTFPALKRRATLKCSSGTVTEVLATPKRA